MDDKAFNEYWETRIKYLGDYSIYPTDSERDYAEEAWQAALASKPVLSENEAVEIAVKHSDYAPEVFKCSKVAMAAIRAITPYMVKQGWQKLHREPQCGYGMPARCTCKNPPTTTGG